MSMFAKIGIIGMAVIAVVIGALYYIFVYSRERVGTETGVEEKDASADNSLPINKTVTSVVTGKPSGIPDPLVNRDIVTPPIPWSLTVVDHSVNGTPQPLSGAGAQNSSSLPPLSITDTTNTSPARGVDLPGATMPVPKSVAAIPPPKEGDVRGTPLTLDTYSANAPTGMEIYHNNKWYQVFANTGMMSVLNQKLWGSMAQGANYFIDVGHGQWQNILGTKSTDANYGQQLRFNPVMGTYRP